MPFQGTLTRVIDKDKQWILLIDVDEHGDKWFTLFDKKYAGQDSKGNKALCDVHQMIGERVIYSAVRGALKDKNGPEDGERFNPVIESIILETVDIPSVRELNESKEEAERVATLQAEVSAIEAEIEREATPADLSTETGQVSAESPSDALRTLTMKMINSIGEWATEIERRTKGA